MCSLVPDVAIQSDDDRLAVDSRRRGDVPVAAGDHQGLARLARRWFLNIDLDDELSVFDLRFHGSVLWFVGLPQCDLQNSRWLAEDRLHVAWREPDHRNAVSAFLYSHGPFAGVIRFLKAPVNMEPQPTREHFDISAIDQANVLP